MKTDGFRGTGFTTTADMHTVAPFGSSTGMVEVPEVVDGSVIGIRALPLPLVMEMGWSPSRSRAVNRMPLSNGYGRTSLLL